MMSPEQENHLTHVKATFSSYADFKYRKGQEEHGGDLFNKTPLVLCENALDEAIDQVVYLITLRDALLKNV